MIAGETSITGWTEPSPGPVLATSPIGRKCARDSAMFAHDVRHRDRARRRSRRPVSLATVVAHRNRLAPTPTHRAAPVGRPTARDAARPDRAGGTRRHHADVEERAASGPTRDASSLAPRGLQGSVALAQSARVHVAHRGRDRGADPHDGARKRAVGGRADST